MLKRVKKPDVFKTAKERYGVWPTTVWECDMSDSSTRILKEKIGDVGSNRKHGACQGAFPSKICDQVRDGCFTEAADDKSVFRGKVTVSIFNPAVASWLLNCYAPSSGVCFDPFAGGGTRAIMAAKHGLYYIGNEIRQEEVDAVEKRVKSCNESSNVDIRWLDSRFCTGIDDQSADFVMTCPPYWNLEMYRGGSADLSMIRSYDEFLEQLRLVIHQTYRILKQKATSCWVVGMLRDENGGLVPLHHDVVRLHKECGYTLQEEIVLYQKNNGAIQRIGMFDRGNRFLVRVHEYALIFKKPKRIKLKSRKRFLVARRHKHV